MEQKSNWSNPCEIPLLFLVSRHHLAFSFTVSVLLLISFSGIAIIKPTCAIVLPTNAKYLKPDGTYVEVSTASGTNCFVSTINFQMSQLFAHFEAVAMHLHKDDNIKSYSYLKWSHLIVQTKIDKHHMYCFEKQEFKLKSIMKRKIKTKIPNLCASFMKDFNIVLPG